MRVLEAVGTATAELGVAQVGHAAEHRRNPAMRPADRVLDLRERPRPIGSRGETVEKLPHEVAAAVVEAGDLVGIAQSVPQRVLAKRGWALDAGHHLSIEGSVLLFFTSG